MKSILAQIQDPQLHALVGCINNNSSSRLISKYFKRIADKYPQYDEYLLWLLIYKSDYSEGTLQYLEANYVKYRQVLDAGFAKKITSKQGFESHVWEMILCDVLSSYGTLVPKGEAGADLLLQDSDGTKIQIEAVVPNEAVDAKYQSIKPDYSEGNTYSGGGKISELELPTLLRFLKGFDDKYKKGYDTSKPLIIAVNTGLVTGISSFDQYILRMALFGLGCQTITRRSDGSMVHGLQQVPFLDKGNGKFPIARFRDSKYRHISGVIYSSQRASSLTPTGYGWGNSGVTFVPNPLAEHPVSMNFDCMSTLIVNENEYREEDAKEAFVSNVI